MILYATAIAPPHLVHHAGVDTGSRVLPQRILPWNVLCCGIPHEEGYHMHDPALWTNWYIALLLFPFMIIALLLRDFLAGRGRRR
jgi:hypothetical protein